MSVYIIKRTAAVCAALCALALSGCSLFYLTRSRAIDIALANEGITGDNCTFVRADLAEDGGEPRWEIEFYKDNIEYDYVIDARSGEIVEFDHDIDGFAPPTSPSPNEGVAV